MTAKVALWDFFLSRIDLRLTTISPGGKWCGLRWERRSRRQLLNLKSPPRLKVSGNTDECRVLHYLAVRNINVETKRMLCKVYNILPEKSKNILFTYSNLEWCRYIYYSFTGRCSVWDTYRYIPRSTKLSAWSALSTSKIIMVNTTELVPCKYLNKFEKICSRIESKNELGLLEVL